LDLTPKPSQFRENAHEFVPTPLDARLKWRGKKRYLWQTDGAAFPYRAVHIPYRLYSQERLGQKATLIHEGVYRPGQEQEVMGIADDGAILLKKHLQQPGLTGSWTKPPVYKYLACGNRSTSQTNGIVPDSVRRHIFVEDAVASLPVDVEYPHFYRLNVLFEDLLRQKRREGLDKRGISSGRIVVEVSVKASAIWNKGSSGQKTGEFVLYFSNRYRKWENLVHFSPAHAKLRASRIWPIASADGDSMLIWNGREWHSVLWQGPLRKGNGRRPER